MNDATEGEWLRAAHLRDTAPADLAERVLETVAYRARLHAPIEARRAKRLGLGVASGFVAVAALLGLWVRALQPATSQATAEQSGAASGASPAPSSAAPPADPCVSRVTARGQHGLIDDFEDGDDALLPSDGRAGFWRWARESDAPGTAPALLPVPRPGASAKNRLALRAKGGQLHDWGATVEVNFRPPCYDASAYAGVTLQARGPGRVFVALREVGVIPPFEGGTCLRDCYNAHVAKLELGREFRTYELRWDELRQRGIGKPALDPSRLHSVAVLIHPEDTPYDVWLDDVRFIVARESPSR